MATSLSRYNIPMADSLYLSIWFPTFREEEMMLRTGRRVAAVPILVAARRRHLPVCASGRRGASPPCWSAASIPASRPKKPPRWPRNLRTTISLSSSKRSGTCGFPTKTSMARCGCRSQSPCASWFMECNSTKASTPRTATSRCDFGLDTSFIYEEREISPFIEKHLRSNIAKLVAFSAAVEKNCGCQRESAVVGIGREPGAEADRETAADTVGL